MYSFSKSNSYLCQAMKRILLTFLAILYLGNSTGFAMHFHYCMDKLVQTNLIYSDLELKDCGMHEDSNNKKSDCCEDEVKSIKSNTDQLSAESSLKLMQAWAVSLPPVFYEIPAISNSYIDVAGNPNSNAPPDIQVVPVYLRNCVFRI